MIMPKVSVIIPTKDRPKDLGELLKGILTQDYRPLEVIVVDDSQSMTALPVVNSLRNKFISSGIDLLHIKGSGEGLPSARNIGITNSKGDIVCFFDDDILFLDKSTIRKLVTFMISNSKVLCVQPIILTAYIDRSTQEYKIYVAKGPSPIENAIYKVLMVTYCDIDRFDVRRSGMSIFPLKVTKVIEARRLSGCFFCCKREVFRKVLFDTKLKRWGYMEDLDFSYRVYSIYNRGLYLVPYTKILHKCSPASRLPSEKQRQMEIIYWAYVFFKNFFKGSIINLFSFLWALVGYGLIILGRLIVKDGDKNEWRKLIFLLKAYLRLLKNMKNIIQGDLEFFNREL